MRFVSLAFALCIAAVSAPTWAQLSETVSRPVGIYRFNPTTEKTDYMLVNLYTDDLATFRMEDTNRQPVCKGQLQTQGRDWILRNVSCFNGTLALNEIVFAERYKFGVLRHGLSVYPLPDGSQIGFFLHLGNESTIISEARVSDEKIKELYGEFPNWKIPK